LKLDIVEAEEIIWDYFLPLLPSHQPSRNSLEKMGFSME